MHIPMPGGFCGRICEWTHEHARTTQLYCREVDRHRGHTAARSDGCAQSRASKSTIGGSCRDCRHCRHRLSRGIRAYRATRVPWRGLSGLGERLCPGTRQHSYRAKHHGSTAHTQPAAMELGPTGRRGADTARRGAVYRRGCQFQIILRKGRRVGRPNTSPIFSLLNSNAVRVSILTSRLGRRSHVSDFSHRPWAIL